MPVGINCDQMIWSACRGRWGDHRNALRLGALIQIRCSQAE
jgi:hypothetical protein